MKRWQARALYWPTLGYNVLLGRVIKVRHWWDSVEPQVLLGAVPFQRDASRLHKLGVTGVVNMCEEYAGPVKRYEQFGIEQLYLPTTDFQHPSAQSVEAGADFIEKQVKQGGKVYVHCKAGRARSATIVLWWLVRYRHLTPEQAQAHMAKARPHVSPTIYLRPVIQELYAKLQKAEQPSSVIPSAAGRLPLSS